MFDSLFFGFFELKMFFFLKFMIFVLHETVFQVREVCGK